jgi:hypothetical protein
MQYGNNKSYLHLLSNHHFYQFDKNIGERITRRGVIAINYSSIKINNQQKMGKPDLDRNIYLSQ